MSSCSCSESEDDSEEGDEDGGSDREEDGNWDEDKEWKQLQSSIREERKKKEAKMKRDSYPVHAPFFPVVRDKRAMFAVRKVSYFCFLLTRRSTRCGGCIWLTGE